MVAGGWGTGRWGQAARRFPFGVMKMFGDWAVLVAACECAKCHWTVHCNVVTMVNLMSREFYHDKTKLTLPPIKLKHWEGEGNGIILLP